MNRRLCLVLLLLVCASSWLFAQRSGRYRQRSSMQDRGGLPTWEIPPKFKKDVFTFVRIRYGGYRSDNRWTTDYPDAELNLSYRLKEMTSLQVDPEGKVLELSDPELFEYPFIYIVEPGDLVFTEEEARNLRKYLLNGGFLMVDDFWGEDEWDNFYTQIKRVLPESEPIELPISHPIFHCVFDIKKKHQIPSIPWGVQSQYTGRTWERDDAQTPHFRAMFDSKNRMMVMIIHNSDLGDGWEREGENEYYFREFSEKIAYPLGINIIFYAMTH